MDKTYDDRTLWYWQRLYASGVQSGLEDKGGRVDREYMVAMPHMMEALSITCNGLPDWDDYIWFKMSTLRYLVTSTENVLSYLQNGASDVRSK